MVQCSIVVSLPSILQTGITNLPEKSALFKLKKPLFSASIIIWVFQAVNFLDIMIEDGRDYLVYIKKAKKEKVITSEQV